MAPVAEWFGYPKNHWFQSIVSGIVQLRTGQERKRVTDLNIMENEEECNIWL